MSGTLIFVHSLLRYFVIILTIVVAAQAVMGMTGNKTFTPGNRKAALFMMIACDLQLLVGLGVYFLGGHLQAMQQPGAMANHYTRFYGMEHPMSMIIGIVLVHLAYKAAKSAMGDAQKFKRVFWFAFIALLLFVSQTPWPSKKDTAKPWLPGMAMISAPAAAHA